MAFWFKESTSLCRVKTVQISRTSSKLTLFREGEGKRNFMDKTILWTSGVSEKGPRNPLFLIWGILTPVQGGWVHHLRWPKEGVKPWGQDSLSDFILDVTFDIMFRQMLAYLDLSQMVHLSLFAEHPSDGLENLVAPNVPCTFETCHLCPV